ncbi:MAG: penicillin-binding transpeptidase domain-containing protein [Phycisphaerales bacterium]
MNPDALIPSMFHRRLTLLLTLIGVALVVLVGRLYQLTVVQGAERRGEAESVLFERELLPTRRGRILDRNGLVLAVDQPCFDVMVDYRLISGEWVEQMAAQEARRLRRDDWDQMSRADREAFIVSTGLRERYHDEVAAMWGDIARISGEPLTDILDRRDEIRDTVERRAESIWERWREQREREYQTTVTLEEVKRPIREQREPHAILRRIGADYEAEFLRFAATGPKLAGDRDGVTIRPSGVRAYPWSDMSVVLDRSTMPSPLRSDEPLVVEVKGVATRLLGGMRTRVYEEDVARRPLRDSNGEIADLGGYTDGDHVGAHGLERSLEDHLRGARGLVIRRLDTGEEQRIPPHDGRDVELAIDIRLQARIEAILDPSVGLTRVQPWHGKENELPIGTPLDAAIAVVDIDSGDVLALVSSDGHDRVADTLKLEDDQREALGLDAAWIHKAIEKPYPPGSIVKPLMLCAAVTDHDWSINATVDCQGHFFPGRNDIYRCWVYRPPTYAVHGPLDAVAAVARSCNIYFYSLGRLLGPEAQHDWYGRWGAGRALDIGVWMNSGVVQDAAMIDGGEQLMLGIGQGPVGWTPLHAANAYAALARGGYFLDPTLVRPTPGDERERYRADLGLDDLAVHAAMMGLDEVVNNQSYGGARRIDIAGDPDNPNYEPIFNLEGARFWGKTGTAQQNWPRKILAFNPDGAPVLENRRAKILEREGGIGAHSWFVGLVGHDPGEGRSARPEFAIAVLVEWGGSGSRAAAPIANQIAFALRQEGYLP